MRWFRSGLMLLLAACPQSSPVVVAGPRIAVRPSAVTFGELTVGDTALAELTLSNEGNGVLNVQGVEVVGAGGFVVAVLPGAQLEAQDSVQLAVRFAPSRAGAHAGVLRVTTDAIDLPLLEVPLQGWAVEPSACAVGGNEGMPCDDQEPCTSGDVCRSGLCRGEPMACDTPPGPSCETAASLLTFQGPGLCREGRCEYPSARTACGEGCAENACRLARCPAGTCAKGLALGFQSSCAIGADAGVWCWGVNFPDLGDGVSMTSSFPVRVLTSAAAVQISDGCALEADGQVECWSSNGSSGTGTPRRIAFDAGVLALSQNTGGGGASCAILGDGRVQCWGSNNHGQLGDGTTSNRGVPTDVVGLPSDVTGVFLGFLHACAATRSGGLWCWGQATSGQLGTGAPWDAGTSTPQLVPLAGFTSASLGSRFTCGLVGPQGAVWCWGSNEAGQLGTGAPDAGLALGPVGAVAVGSGFTQLTATLSSMCGLRADGSVWCWGENQHGQLGRGLSTRLEARAMRVPLDAGVVELSAGAEHVCARRGDGRITCWGGNQWGQLGDGASLQLSDNYGPVDALLP